MTKVGHIERLGLLGGTFDPIHMGHLDAAVAARSALALDEVWLVPSRVPPHRHERPHSSPFHRFAMVALAVQEADHLVASDLELGVDGPSYTSGTLERLAAAGWAPWQLFFITGADAFAEIDTWMNYPALLDQGQRNTLASSHAKRFAAQDYVELTMHFRCNLKCVHCMIEGTMDWLKPQSMDQFDEILARNSQQGRWKGLILTGSEVTLRQDLPELARMAATPAPAAETRPSTSTVAAAVFVYARTGVERWRRNIGQLAVVAASDDYIAAAFRWSHLHPMNVGAVEGWLAKTDGAADDEV